MCRWWNTYSLMEWFSSIDHKIWKGLQSCLIDCRIFFTHSSTVLGSISPFPILYCFLTSHFLLSADGWPCFYFTEKISRGGHLYLPFVKSGNVSAFRYASFALGEPSTWPLVHYFLLLYYLRTSNQQFSLLFYVISFSYQLKYSYQYSGNILYL